MRYSLLVAWREFAENVKTKGFWIGIFIFPFLLLISFSAGGWLEKTKPVRNFVLVDQSGKFEAPIQAALERLYQREVLKSFGIYVQKNLAAKAGDGAGEGKPDLEKIPASGAEEALARWAGDNPEMLEQFTKDGGVDAALAQVRSMLRPGAPAFEAPRHMFRRVELPPDLKASATTAELADALKPYLRGEHSIQVEGASDELFSAVLIPADILEHVVRPGGVPQMPGSERVGIQYWSTNLADEDLKDEIETALNDEVRRLEYVEQGVDAQSVQKVQKTHLPFAALNPKKEAGEEAVSIADKIRQWAPMGFVYLLWVGIFTIAQMLLNNTIEEKSNRIIEVLLSSVTPGELMMGKLMGIAAVGLTMIGTWITFLMLILKAKAGPEAEFASELFKVLQTSGLLPAFLVYFLLGYLLYAGAFLAIGSLCNTLKEAQNMMGPIMVIMIVPLMTMAFIPKDPNGTLATALSWIPPYTPFVMMNRAAADPPLFDRVGTLVLLVASTALVLWLSGKIFRIGVLRTGQPPKFAEVLRWIRGT